MYFRKRLSAEACLAHRWMVQDVKVMKAKRLSTEKHKRFMARAKWQVSIFELSLQGTTN